MSFVSSSSSSSMSLFILNGFFFIILVIFWIRSCFQSSSSSLIFIKESYGAHPSTAYSTVQDSSTSSFLFQVSSPRKQALDSQVQRCPQSYDQHYEEPWILGPKQCQTCHSYTRKGGYDAQKWNR